MSLHALHHTWAKHATERCSHEVCSLPDVLIRGEQDDCPGVASVQQQTDDFIEVGEFVVMRDLQRLSDTDSTWTHEAKGDINIQEILNLLLKYAVFKKHPEKSSSKRCKSGSERTLKRGNAANLEGAEQKETSSAWHFMKRRLFCTHSP